jgi:hypothetical protein
VSQRQGVYVAAAIVLVAFALRASPYLASGVPYHTDTYPQLANARNLVASTPVPLGPGNGFGPYNILWPADTLFYAVSSVLLGPAPVSLMPLLGPLVTSLMAVLFFALLRSLGLEAKASAIATLLFAVAGGTTMISAGVTKEAFALPLMVLVVLLLNIWLKDGKKGALALSAFSFVVLLAAHSLASVVGLLLCCYLVMAYALSPGGRSRVAATSAALALFSVAAYLYFYVHAVSSLPYDLHPSDVIAAFAYEALLTAPVWVAGAFRLGPHRWTSAWLAALSVLVAGLFASALAFHTLLDSPVASPYVLVLVTPYVAVALLSSAGMRWARGTAYSRGAVFASLWALGVLGLVGFSAFATPGAIGTTMRILDFVYPGAAALAAVALVKLMGTRRWTNLAGLAAVALLVAGSAYIVPYSAYWSGPLGGSQRVYSQAEVSSLVWAGQSPPGQRIYADARFGYLSSYYGGNVSSGPGFLYLAGLHPLGPGCLILDGLIGEIGYVGGTYGHPVNMTIVAGLPSQTSLQRVYANGRDSTYCRP